MKEIVLPSGVFAALRPLKLRDRLEALGATKDSPDFFVADLIARATTVDGVQLTREGALDMDSRDFDAICEAMQEYLKGPIK